MLKKKLITDKTRTMKTIKIAYMQLLILLAIACQAKENSTRKLEKVETTAENAEVEKLKPGKNKVNFKSKGEKIVGDLYLPADFDKSKSYPAIVVDGSWTTVKEQMQSLYASRLAEKGYVTLAFDHRYYGESGGEPREYEDHEAKVEDIRAALNYLETLKFVKNDRLAGLGVCASGAYMLDAASRDNRFKSMATVAAWLMTPETAKLIYGGDEGVNDRISKARAAREKFETSKEATYVSAYDPNNPEAAMFFPVDYYAKSTRGAVPTWNNNFAVMSWDRWLTYDGVTPSKNVNIPVILIHSEKASLPDGVRAAYENISNPNKEIVWMNEYQHDEFYDNPEAIDKAVDMIVEQFSKTL